MEEVLLFLFGSHSIMRDSSFVSSSGLALRRGEGVLVWKKLLHQSIVDFLILFSLILICE